MYYVGIDLAERHSSAVVLDHAGRVVLESTLDAGQQEKPPNPWKNVEAVRNWWRSVVDPATEDYYAQYVIEVPHFHARNGEPALIVHGALLSAMLETGVDPASVLRIKAMEWQHFFGFSKSEHGNTKTWAEEYARTALGYTPGMTWAEGTRMVKKMREDLIDGRLLAEWRRQNSSSEPLAS